MGSFVINKKNFPCSKYYTLFCTTVPSDLTKRTDWLNQNQTMLEIGNYQSVIFQTQRGTG